ncbi:hypothetical protein [Nonomuraea sp. 10N515B]
MIVRRVLELIVVLAGTELAKDAELWCCVTRTQYSDGTSPVPATRPPSSA